MGALVSRRNVAKVRVLQLERDTRRYEVECPDSVTGLTWCDAGGLGLTDGQLIVAVVYMHEERCDGGCDLEPVFARGDPTMREATDRLWAELRMEDRQN